MHFIFCNGSHIGQRATAEQAAKFVADRQARYPKSKYEVIEGDKVPAPSDLNPSMATASAEALPDYF